MSGVPPDLFEWRGRGKGWGTVLAILAAVAGVCVLVYVLVS